MLRFLGRWAGLFLSLGLAACGGGGGESAPARTLTVALTGQGTVSSSAAGIDCGSDCSEP